MKYKKKYSVSCIIPLLCAKRQSVSFRVYTHALDSAFLPRSYIYNLLGPTLRSSRLSVIASHGNVQRARNHFFSLPYYRRSTVSWIRCYVTNSAHAYTTTCRHRLHALVSRKKPFSPTHTPTAPVSIPPLESRIRDILKTENKKGNLKAKEN